MYQLQETIPKGLATRNGENKQNRSQVNTNRFRSSLNLPHENEDTPVVQSDEKNTMLLFLLLSQFYCLKMIRGFRFFQQKTTANLLLYKIYILF